MAFIKKEWRRDDDEEDGPLSHSPLLRVVEGSRLDHEDDSSDDDDEAEDDDWGNGEDDERRRRDDEEFSIDVGDVRS